MQEVNWFLIPRKNFIPTKYTNAIYANMHMQNIQCKLHFHKDLILWTVEQGL